MKIAALALGIFLVGIRASIPLDVVELGDQYFEHDTQASTGQTTGIWSVFLPCKTGSFISLLQ
jgi:hypothetical protein